MRVRIDGNRHGRNFVGLMPPVKSFSEWGLCENNILLRMTLSAFGFLVNSLLTINWANFAG